ncbi:twin-arginine translocase TatA/TatE family subunit [Collinsella intestinalis]|uniref:twin-arginine translocase TatA/TatE family subunit n=1 Tax=Collinsella intestinalis TaxID=147207 RepID=UPI00195B838E|nr:twin-arginine translocase TatA/TatE family subunit [Collinsella intestinalis]MBM6907696.1 twin-arginine translocase TatA/TatE family subunit [Collinsella intestinalis]MBM6943172.1 twin-arginine translocase TatA/TatE family subunit [Collinsella intestinalis]MDM8163247.1 twin-arginine translocase TatA/TatE family subunit [Collinsella intestinalis]HIU04137.1 twin-arginine translocase TatA/TatE family subunit [Candidatus Coprousia avicola]
MGFLPKGTEWIIILVIVLVIFGPKNLPKLGASLGKTVKNLREGMQGDDEATAEEAEAPVEDENDAKIRELEEQLAEAKKKKEEQDAE